MNDNIKNTYIEGLVAANEFSIDSLEKELAEQFSIEEKDFRTMLMESESIEELMDKVTKYKRK